MIPVSITLNSQSYTLKCEPGQEKRLRELAQHVDNKIKSLSQGARRHVNESQTFIMTCLLLADEIFDLREKLAVKISTEVSLSEQNSLSGTVEETINRLAQRLEDIAYRLNDA